MGSWRARSPRRSPACSSDDDSAATTSTTSAPPIDGCADHHCRCDHDGSVDHHDHHRSRSSTSDPFTLGVASGDPLPDAVVLWTRLLPAGTLPDTDIEVEWEVATDAELTDVVASGTATAVAALGPLGARRRHRTATRHRVLLPVPPR